MTKLTPEQRAALESGSAVLVDDASDRRFVLVEEEIHLRAMEALRRQEDVAAIRKGLDDMEAGRVKPFAAVDARLREKLGLPPHS